MKDYPKYNTIKYYYSDQKSSDKLLFGESAHKNGIFGELVGSLILTEDGIIYLNLNKGYIITPDSLRDDRCYPLEWQNVKCIKYAIDYQPYDVEGWCDMKAYAMYSKSFWYTAYRDIREVKINISLDEFNK